MLSCFTLRAAALTLACAFPLQALADGIEVHDAYAISAGPAAPAGAAFMVIHNHGGPDDRLIGVASPAAQRVELHTHIAGDDGTMRMVHVEEGFDLPRDGEIVMQRGGHHVMFMGLTAPFEQGMILPVTLSFAVAGDVLIEVPVDLERLTEGATDSSTMDHATMDHGAMDHGAMDDATGD